MILNQLKSAFWIDGKNSLHPRAFPEFPTFRLLILDLHVYKPARYIVLGGRAVRNNQ